MDTPVQLGQVNNEVARFLGTFYESGMRDACSQYSQLSKQERVTAFEKIIVKRVRMAAQENPSRAYSGVPLMEEVFDQTFPHNVVTDALTNLVKNGKVAFTLLGRGRGKRKRFVLGVRLCS